ncbi:MAG: hypothetical protein R3B70_29500 [Polyangiaceae bacterium]
MSRAALRARARPTLLRRALGIAYRIVRVLMVLAAAIGPGMPPPPPPPRPTADMVVSGAKEGEEE